MGIAVSAEFEAFIALYQNLPDLEAIMAGKGQTIPFPNNASIRYATTIGLTVRVNDATQGYNAFAWLAEKATAEWVQLYAVDLVKILRDRGEIATLSQLIKKDKKLQTFFQDFRNLIGIL